jgi:hypothetical protein
MTEMAVITHRQAWMLSAVWVGGAVVCVNLALLGFAFYDRSWGAFGVSFVFGPVANAVLSVVSMASAGVMRRRAGVPVLQHIAISIVGPLMAAFVDMWVVSSMRLHGC